jgi:hypothetical protein
MNDGLLMIERIVIESLSKKEKNIKELEFDTNLNHGLLLNVLPNLLMKNILRYKMGIYSLEMANNSIWLSDINRQENVKEEVKEMFTSLVNQYFEKDTMKNSETRTHFKVQKMWLTKDEEMVLKSHMAVLEGFFLGVKEARRSQPQKEKTCEQRVVIWGFSQYSDLIDGVLKAV